MRPTPARLAATAALAALLPALTIGVLPARARAEAQVGRALSGALIARETILLPKGALMVVALETLDGTRIAETRRPTEGAQLPLPFAIQGPANAPIALRAAVFDGGREILASAPVMIKPGRGTSILPPVLLTRNEAIGFASAFRCGDTDAEVSFAGGSARLMVAGASYILTPDKTASGARYSAAPGADGKSDTWFWSKGNAATVRLKGRTLPECHPEIAAPVFPIRAGGSEPGWRLEITASRMRFTPQEGAPLDLPLPAPDPIPTGLRFAAPDGALTADVTRALCRDGATALPHPLQVTVTTGGRTHRGCGGLPADLLTGAPWTVERAASARLGGIGTEMRFLANQVSGKGPCNRFSARIMFGEGMRMGPVAATRMTCSNARMEKEAALFNALGATDGFDIRNGELRLLARGQVVLVARRQTPGQP
ncbi:META domain-containing protein [Acidimangrovimonas sediminis]|uniref:META domain-containing protein n=1 Tax=Acidimangrovimonas sediminis TaxID=2056283 RepID=UPI000C80E430|nr:META domain-containing protein [Acidimangrovimonas sediminis]